MKKENDILFSIIVPVYNVEKYVLKSLDSIVDAMDTDCEVIIINDGSKDNCDKIIKEYIKKLPKNIKDNFIYIYKENKGLADTKNLGIKKARGKYISVVDSDDRISREFYSTARPYINEGYDVIVYDLYLDYEKNHKLNNTIRALREDYEGAFINQLMMGAMVGSSCNKIIKKSLYKYKFPVGKEYEDVTVTPFILIDAKKIKYIPNPNYIYLQREQSIVSSNTLDGAFYKICSNISEVLNKNGNFDKYEEIIHVFFIDRTIDMFDLSLKHSSKKFIKKLKQFYNDNKNIINYVVENNVIEKKKENLTTRQYKVLNMIYLNLYNKKYRKVKLLIRLRRIVNWLRNILSALKMLIRAIIGGTHE